MDINKVTLKKINGKQRHPKCTEDSNTNLLAASDVLVGVEIEVENFYPRHEAEVELQSHWTVHDEGSLVDGTEWVLYPPRNGSQLTAALDMFFDPEAYEYTTAERTSVHLHANMMDGTTVGQFRSMFALAYILEGAIFRNADENRKWCSYCCPISDMSPDRFNGILNAADEDRFKVAIAGNDHEDKYYGFNSVSILKHGTIELRYFPCTKSKAQMLKWINMMLELKIASRKFPTANLLAAEFSTTDSVTEFLRKHMPMSADDLSVYIDRLDAVARANRVLAVVEDEEEPAIPAFLQVKAAPNKNSKAIDKLLRVRFGQKTIGEKLKAAENAAAMSKVPPPAPIGMWLDEPVDAAMNYQQIYAEIAARQAEMAHANMEREEARRREAQRLFPDEELLAALGVGVPVARRPPIKPKRPANVNQRLVNPFDAPRPF